jgi:hypothetical protein
MKGLGAGTVAAGAIAEPTGAGDPFSSENRKAGLPLLDQSVPQRKAPLSFRRVKIGADTLLGE